MSRKRTLATDPIISNGDEKDNFDDENTSSPPQQPIRDTTHLFASPITISCAHQCVPCAYKIGLFDVTLDTDFCKQVPNQRPEQCPRSSTPLSPTVVTLGFQTGMSVLTVGDGDFSFSLALARRLKPRDTKSSLVATSYEDKETLQETYPNFDETLAELESLGASICYKVDATRLKETLPASSVVNTFHRICWNFPCTAITKGQDGQNDDMERNKDLVRGFVRNSRYLLSPVDGEIHMCHKTKPPFNHWKLEHVALENLQEGDDDGPLLLYAGRVILDRFLLPPYSPRKALDRKSFPCHDACFYIFCQEEETTPVGDAKTFPPTIDLGTTDSVNAPAIPVTPEVILAVRKSLLYRAASKRQNQNNQRRKRQVKIDR